MIGYLFIMQAMLVSLFRDSCGHCTVTNSEYASDENEQITYSHEDKGTR